MINFLKGKQFNEFYDDFPELEIAAKIFVTEKCQQKNCSFRVLDLCEYIDSKYYEITETSKESSILIRSETAVRADLKKWGFEFGDSTCIYFEGHERADVERAERFR